ncbi:MAG: PaaI family thioesterase [Oscillospiraceae bacterium]|nr:PaaI family thioesterase [Oscillospiraceae bacterium]
MESRFEPIAEQIFQRFGLRYLKMEQGVAEAELRLKPEDQNYLGVPFGGVIFNLADLTAGAALRSLGSMGVTVSAEVRFLRGVTGLDKLRCRAEVRKAGGSLVFVDASVYTEQGQELAALSFIFARKKEEAGRLQ